MAKDQVLYRQEGSVVTIRLNCPEVRNGMDWETLEALSDAYDAISGNPEIKAVIMTGTGQYFNTGGIVDTANAEEKARYNKALTRMTQSRDKIDVPTIAAVNGECSAGGMLQLATADLAVAVDTARFGFPEVTHGAFPIMVMVPTISVMPKKKALEAFYTGELFSAQEAADMGFLNRVVPEVELWPAVQYYVEHITKLDKEVLRIGRETYYGMMALPERQRSEYGMQALQRVWQAKENSKANS